MTPKKYYVLTKPGIVYSNALSAAAGFLLAARWRFDWALGGTFAALVAGVALVIASACVFNNYIDRGIDRKMARTRARATATGEVSGPAALGFGGVLGVLGFLVLIAYTNWLVVGLGALAVFSYVVLYGWAKRHTVHGTLVGTLPGGLPPVGGYAAVTHRLDTGALLLFVILVCWQMAHFYAIALRRTEDYRAAGLPVMPVVRGVGRTKRAILWYIAAFLGACIGLSAGGYAGWIFGVVMGGLAAYWLWRGIASQRLDGQKWGGQMFGVSLIVLLSLEAMLSVGSILP